MPWRFDHHYASVEAAVRDVGRSAALPEVVRQMIQAGLKGQTLAPSRFLRVTSSGHLDLDTGTIEINLQFIPVRS